MHSISAPNSPQRANVYGELPEHKKKKPSARDIMDIMNSRKNFRGVSKAFDSLVQEGHNEVDSAKRAIPSELNLYKTLLKLPKPMKSLKFLSTRKYWYHKKIAFKHWLSILQIFWDERQHYNDCIIRIQRWAKHIIVMKKIWILNEVDDNDGDGDGDGKPVDKTTAFAINSVKLIKGQITTIIQKYIRRWLSKSFALPRQIIIKRNYINNKMSLRIQRLFRGYFTRAMFCNYEKKLLLKQLRLWAQGSTQKLLGRSDLADAKYQHMILRGIYMAALPSRPLRNLPTLIDILSLRGSLQKLQDSIETEHSILQTEYNNRTKERLIMKFQDITDQYIRNNIAIQLANDIQSKQDAINKRNRIIEEELKLKQRKNAMSVMAYYNLEQNNQRVEREQMFREEHKMRKYIQYINNRSLTIIQIDHEKMLNEDEISKKIRNYNFEQIKQKEILNASALAVKKAHLQKTGGNSLDKECVLFHNIIPNWAQYIDNRTIEEKRIDEIKNILCTSLKDIEFCSKLRKKAGEKIPPALPEDVLTHKKILSGLKFQCYNHIDDDIMKQRINLGHLRCLKNERKLFYIKLQNVISDFIHKHSELNKIRNILKSNKFQSRGEKHIEQKKAQKKECEMPAARAEVIRHCRRYGDVYKAEIELFLKLFMSIRQNAPNMKIIKTKLQPPPISVSVSASASTSASTNVDANMKSNNNNNTDTINNSSIASTSHIASKSDSGGSPTKVTSLASKWKGAALKIGKTTTEEVIDTQHQSKPSTPSFASLDSGKDKLSITPKATATATTAVSVSTSTSTSTSASASAAVDTSDHDITGITGETSSSSSSSSSLSSGMPLEDILPPQTDINDRTNMHAKWAKNIGINEDGTAEKDMDDEEIKRRREFWGTNISEHCRVGIIRGMIEPEDGFPLPFFALPPSYPIERSANDGDSVPVIIRDFSSSQRNTSLGSSLREQFGLEFSDNDNDSLNSGYSSKSGINKNKNKNNQNSTSKSAKKKQKDAEEKEQQRLAAIATKKELRNNSIPGFTSYTLRNANDYDFIQWAYDIQLWSGNINSWMTCVEEKWRNIHRASLITSFQRMEWMMNSDEIDKNCLDKFRKPSNRGDNDVLSYKYDYINCNDDINSLKFHKTSKKIATPSSNVANYDPLILYEISLCKINWEFHLQDNNTNEYYNLIITSEQAEKYFGLHPFSHIALFLLQNRLKGGNLMTIQKQANITRDGVSNRWTRSIAKSSHPKMLTKSVSTSSPVKKLSLGNFKNAAKKIAKQSKNSSNDDVATTGYDESDVSVSVVDPYDSESSAGTITSPNKRAMTSPKNRDGNVSDGEYSTDGSIGITRRSSISASTSTSPTTSRPNSRSISSPDQRGSPVRPFSRGTDSKITPIVENVDVRPSSRGRGTSDVITPFDVANRGTSNNSATSGSDTSPTKSTSRISGSSTSGGVHQQRKQQKFNFDDDSRKSRENAMERSKAVKDAKKILRLQYADVNAPIRAYIDKPESKLSFYHQSNIIKKFMIEERKQMKNIITVLLDRDLLTLLGRPKAVPTFEELQSTKSVSQSASVSTNAKDSLPKASPYLDSLGLGHAGKPSIPTSAGSGTGTSVSTDTHKPSPMEVTTSISQKKVAPAPAHGGIKRASSTVGLRKIGGGGVGVGALSKLQRASSTILRDTALKKEKAKKVAAASSKKQNETTSTSTSSSSSSSSSSTFSNNVRIGINIYFHKCLPTLFVQTVKTMEDITILVPRWMRPICYWGDEAGQEPFWRRLQLEEHGGIIGKYTLANRKDNRIEKTAKTLAYGLHVRLLCAHSAKEAIVAPVRQKLEIDCMNWEDALSISMRQVWRARRQRLSKVKSFSLSNLKKKKSNFDGFWALVKKIKDFGISILPKYDPEKWHISRLAKRPMLQGQTMAYISNHAECEVDRGSQADSQNPDYSQLSKLARDRVAILSRKYSWVTGEEVRVDAATGKHKNLIEPNQKNTNRARNLMKQLAGTANVNEMLDASASANSNTNTNTNTNTNASPDKVDAAATSNSTSATGGGNNLNKSLEAMQEFERNALRALSQWPKIPECWVCGGSKTVVTVMRVIDQEAAVPRGGIIVELVSGAGATELRCGFQGKRALCDDDKKSFGNFISVKSNGNGTGTRSRVLSVDANKRMRQCETPTKELPNIDAYFSTVLLTIYESRHSFNEAKNIIAKIQGMLRIRRARARIQFLKDAIQRRLLQESMANADSDDDDDDGDVDGDDDDLDAQALPPVMLKR